jgi:hypothetical protein
LLPNLEALETQSSALLELLKAKNVITAEELAPCLDQAGKASNVRWRATRLRIEYLLANAAPDKAPQPATPGQQNKSAEAQTEKAGKQQKKSQRSKSNDRKSSGKAEEKSTTSAQAENRKAKSGDQTRERVA